jgi:hypothetical protein
MKKTVLFLGIAICFLLSGKSRAQSAPTASFSLSQTSVCVGSSVQVTDQSSDTPTLWSYTVDGMYTDNSVSQNPVFTFTAAGVYSISLISENANGPSGVYTETVEVDALPVVSISGQPAVCLGSAITQTANGADIFTWNTSANTGVITDTPVSTTVYSVVGTNTLTGCSNFATNTVVVNPLPVVSINSGAICSGDNFTFTPTGATSYTYPGGTNVESPSSTTAYTITGEDVNGCINTAVSTITVNALPVISVNSGAICDGSSFVITPSGASTYTITGGSFNVNPSTTTSYSVTGTSVDGCVSSNAAVADVTVNALPVVSVNSGSVCEGSSFAITPSGANTYTVTGGSFNVSPSANTSYSVTGTSVDGCVSSNVAVADVTVNALPVVSVNSGSICEGSSFSITPSGAITYTITGGSFNVNPSASTSYSVTGTSVDGCISTAAVADVTVSASPAISANSGAICQGGSFVINPSGASTYSITGGSFTVNPSATSSYSVTGTSVDGCVSLNAAVANVTVETTPVISVNDGTICSGQSFVMIPSGAATYTFSSGSATVVPTGSASYSVIGSSAAGCIATVSAVSNVVVNALPVISVSGGSICAGQNFVMAPSGAITYSFSNGSATVNPTSNASYSVTGTDANGCGSLPVVANITVSPLPNVSIATGTSVCNGQTITLTASGALTYVWNTTATTTAITDAPSTTTTYSVVGLDANGCANIATQLVTVYALPTISANSGSICLGQAFTFVPSGGVTYTVTGGSMVVTPAVTTSYSITGTDANGCVSANPATATVSVNSVTVTVTGNTSVCQGQTTTLTANGASTYSWTNGITTQTVVLSPSTNTTYIAFGFSGGCADTAFVSLTVKSLPVISVNSGSVCAGKSFTITPSGAMSYTVTGGSMTVSPATTSDYVVTGTGANGCVSANGATAHVQVNNLPNVTAGTASATICKGESVVLTANGANNYSWNTNDNTAIISVTPNVNTTYTVTGTDANGCMNVATVTQNVDDCAGIAKNAADNLLVSVFPNPTNGELNVEVSQSTVITVINMVGQVIVRQEVKEGRNTINLDDQNNGIYFVQVKQNGQAKTIKVIKH